MTSFRKLETKMKIGRCLQLQLSVFVAATVVSGLSSFEAGWRLESSAKLSRGGDGATISSGAFNASGWMALDSFPSTVLAALSANGTEPGDDFSLPLYHGTRLNETDATLFDVPWWCVGPREVCMMKALVGCV